MHVRDFGRFLRLFALTLVGVFAFDCAGVAQQPEEKDPVVSPSQAKFDKDASQAAPPEIPTVPEEESVRVERDLPWFSKIEDDAPVRGEDLNADEHKAYNYLLGFASRQDPAVLRKYAMRNVPYKNLIDPIRQDYFLEPLHFEGRLLRLTSMKPTRDLANQGIKRVYEGWLAPNGVVPNPVCILVTELPPGIEPDQDIDRWVSFDGYLFKLMHYESGEKVKRAGMERHMVRRAPLLMGPTFTVQAAPNEHLGSDFTILVAACVLGVLAIIGAFGWWFTRSDRRVKTKLADATNRNPFTNPDPPEPIG